MSRVDADLDRADATAAVLLGQLHTDLLGRKFRYIKYDDGSGNIAAIAGGGVSFLDSSLWVVTGDISDASPVQPAGFTQAALTNGQYGWMQTGGKNRVAITTDGGVADGHALVLDSGNDNDVDTMADGEEEQVIGFATEADSGTSLAVNGAQITIE